MFANDISLLMSHSNLDGLVSERNGEFLFKINKLSLNIKKQTFLLVLIDEKLTWKRYIDFYL